jgi:glycosyltransferase involved in cell wall biosynthesis
MAAGRGLGRNDLSKYEGRGGDLLPVTEKGFHVGRQAERLRVFYSTGGPADIVEAYRQEHLREEGKQPLVTDVSVPYSNLFFEACAATGASAWAVSPHPRVDRFEDGAFIMEHRPMPRLCQKGGLAWHLGTIIYQIGLIRSAIQFRADLAVMASGGHFWFYSVLRLFGIRVVPLLHGTLWPSGFRQTGRGSRIIQWLNGWFWRHHVFASIVVSDECVRQIREIAGKVPGPILVAMPLFRRELFTGIREPPAPHTPFTVMFAGRVERFKGVFDLLDIAATLDRREPGRFVFEVCGSGSALDELRMAVAERGQTPMVRLMGWLNREQMTRAYGRCHVVITPTTSSFEEGFCQVAAESILAGRPLVASTVCPAVDHLGGAVVEVRPCDVEGYAEAIRLLANDSVLYEEKRSACSKAAEPYYDWNEGLGGMMLRVLSHAKADAGQCPQS